MSHQDYPSQYGQKVTIRCAPGTPQPVAKLNEAMESLLIKLLKRKPEWTFALLNNRNIRPLSDNSYHINKIIISQDNEVLGWVGRTHMDSGAWVYGIDCPALLKDRQRGYETRTSKLDKAVSLITDNFKPKPDAERFAEQHAGVKQQLHAAHRNAVEMRQTKITEQTILHAWLVTNIDDLRDRIVADTTINNTTLSKYIECINHEAYVKDLVTNLPNYGVLIHKGGDYTWVDTTGRVIQSYTSDTLPDMVKSKIAKLKLVEPHQMITGVGYRSGPDTYVIMERTK